MKLKDVISSRRGVLRLAYQGKVRYGQWRAGRIYLYEGSPFSGGTPGNQTAPSSQVKLLAPCRPSKVVAVGLNYKGHAAEFGMDLPTEPMIFLKPASSVIGPEEAIVKPAMSRRVDYEAELAVVISRACSRVSADEALDYVLGYTCLNDVTARDLQKTDGQYTRAKGFDTFCPIGPIIAQDLDPGDLYVKSFVDGQQRQNGRTSDLIFPVPELVSFISQVMTLRPGDVIATGTPAGIGPLAPGEIVTIELEGIGRLSNPVVERG
jgi:2-keto-4-pentenoate hydratase/2-oxohepta-3-ene-1,7-dioic acid hydratase in catechol pathway